MKKKSLLKKTWYANLLFIILFSMFNGSIMAQNCDYTVTLFDSWGDGWNGGSLDVLVDGTPVLTGLTISSGAGPENFVLTVTDGLEITTVYTAGSYSTENSYKIFDADGTEMFSDGDGGSTPSGGLVGFAVCPSCDYSVSLLDSWGDGWNGGSLDILVDGVPVLSSLTISSGAGPENHIFTVFTGQAITTIYTAGSYSTENSYYIYDSNGVEVLASGVGGTTPDATGDAGLADCSGIPGCMDPSAGNYDPTATVDDGSCWYTVATPYTEDFENGGSIPLYWTNDAGDGGEDWEFTTTNSHGSTADHTSGTGYYALLNDYSIHYNNSPVNLLTPNFDFSSPGISYQIKYWAWIGADGAANPIHIDVSDDGGATWTNDVFVHDHSTTNTWFENTISLSSFTSNRVVVRFRGVSIWGVNTDNSGIDDITVEETPLFAMDWCNLQWPENATIVQGNSVTVYTQGWEDGVTPGAGAGAGIDVWIGYSTSNTDPSTWTDWVPATYNLDNGNNDEFMADLGLPQNLLPGTYYYASRWQLSGGIFKYGGYNAGGGGFWDGVTNVSGVLTINPYIAVAPFFEDFEDGGATPAYWTNTSSTGEVWQFSTTGIGHSATSDHTSGAGYFASVDDSEYPHSTDVTLTTPFIDLSTLSIPQLDFWFYSDNEGHPNMTLHVNIWDGAAWNNDFASFSGNTSGWENMTVDLATLTISGPIQIQFVGDETSSGSDYYDDISIDDITIDEAPACASPTALATSSITGNSAELSWTAGGTETSWDIEIVETGITPTGTPTYAGLTNPYTVNGLTANTSYDWYVRADCGSSQSSWVGPYTFTTACDAVNTFPWTETFDTWTPDCWDLTGGTFNWVQYGSSSARANFWSHSSGNNAVMTTPTFDVSTLTTPTLNFDWSSGYSSSYPNDELDVLVSDDNGASWVSVWNKTGTDLNSNDGAGSTSPGTFVPSGIIDLSSFGNSLLIRFNAISGYGYDLFVDNVSIMEMPILGCMDPIAENYDPAATLDDGSCIYIEGCMDPLAINYMDTATHDDGSCYFMGDSCTLALDYGLINDPAVTDSTVYAYDVDWYSFTLNNDYGSVVISLCGSAYDTKLEIWDNCSSSSYMYYNDDSYSNCGSGGNSYISIPFLEAGTYYAKVYGYSSYFGDYNLEITGVECDLSIALDNQTNVSCFGGNDGVLDISPLGGTAPYTYLWSSGETTDSIFALPVGTYDITVVDSNGCIATASYSITEPTILAAGISAQTDVNCLGGNDGTATATISGGTSPYSFLWTNGEASETAVALIADTHTLTVTDALGCTTTATVTITEPSTAVVATISSQTNISCNGGSDGSIDVLVEGGTPGYNYSWWPNNETTEDLSNLSAGAYSLTVTDANGCTSVTGTSLTEPAELVASIDSYNNVSCFEGNDAEATVLATGGTSPYSYSWSNGTTDATATALIAGSYTVDITDDMGCTASTSLTISEPALLSASISTQTNVDCYGAATGSATVLATGGTSPYSYLWSNGATDATATDLAAGTFTVDITDDNGCVTSTSVTITQPDEFSVALDSQTNIDCYSGNNGAIDVSIIGGVTPYTYFWSPNGETTQDINALSAYNYALTVTDANGCVALFAAEITQPDVLQINSTQSEVSCMGSDGEINLTIAGGTSPFTYSWSNGASNDNITGLDAGTYGVDVIDANGCSATESFIITEPPALTANISASTNVACYGESTGTATAEAMYGSSPFAYLWSNGATDATATELAAGTYTVTITDNGGCTSSASVEINEADELVATLTSQTNVSCYGGTNGALGVTIIGGVGPYTYLWSSGAGSPTIGGLSAGMYSFTVIDANGCSKSLSTEITQPDELVLTVTSNDVSCFGFNDGNAIVSATGGVAPYTYLWSNGTTDAENVELFAGEYSVIVSDANGCSSEAFATIQQPDDLTGTISSSNVSCNGTSTGSASITVTGGTAAYTYEWSTVGTDATIDNLIADIYFVTITDAHACTFESSVEVTEPDELVVSITSQTNVSCFGLSDGAATAQATGGTAPYTFLWNSGQATASIDNLLAGDYFVTVIDNMGCTAQTDVTILQPSELTAGYTQTDVTCNGANNGEIDLFVNGGTTPYTYSWTPNGETTEDITGLAGGSYSVIITDANGCVTDANILLNEPDELLIGSTLNNVSCNGGNDGEILLTVSGGTAAYSYMWSNGETTDFLAGLSVGNYSVTVHDINGCEQIDEYVITEPSILVASVSSQTNLSCYGCVDGAIDISVTGGATPYSFLWSNGETTEDLSGILAGTYTVIVTDANGCTSTTSAEIYEPGQLNVVLSSKTDVSCFGANDGTVTMVGDGGTTPYTFLWSNGETIESLTGLAGGEYTLTITDDNGLTASASVTIVEPSELIAEIASFDNVSCNGNNDGAIDLSVNGGTMPYTYLWSNGATIPDIPNLGDDSYSCVITDANGCIANAEAEITQPDELVASISLQTNVSCFGGNDGNANAVATGGTLPYSYSWSNNATSAFAGGLAAGTYDVSITDANGCTAITSVIITEPDELIAIVDYQTNVSCFGGNNGAVSIITTGGVLPYSYLWSDGSTNNSLTELTAGTYSVDVTDANGCLTSLSVIITQPTVLSSGINYFSDVSCAGGNDGEASVLASGGTMPYTYLWSNGATTAVINTLTAGTYTVTITDDLGCTSVSSITITEPNILSISSVNSTDVSCYGGNDGSASVLVTGGTLPYSYSWSNGATTANISSLAAGSYTVTVTDANGCITFASITITQPDDLVIVASVTDNVSCFGVADGSANVTVEGGTMPYIYLWSNNASTDNVSGLLAGSYDVTVSDAHGCSSSTSINITEPDLLTATIAASTNVSCNGGNNGEATVLAEGGTMPYSYLWSNSSINETATGLSAGNYTVAIVDVNGCVAYTYAVITEPDVLVSSISTQTNVSCTGGNDGEATVLASGGTSPYSYLWSNGEVTATISGLFAGSYTVTVTDDLGCTSMSTVEITEPYELFPNIVSHTDVSCYGGSNGAASVFVNGGTLPFTYLWSNGATSPNPAGLSAGIYTVTVTDANGCSATAFVEISEPTELIASISSQTNVSCFGGNNGAATILVNGGLSPYVYLWSNSCTDDNIGMLTVGTYTVTVTDDNACEAIESVIITEPTELVSSISSQTDISCNGGDDGSATVSATGGTMPYVYFWSDFNPNSTNDNLVAGPYSVTVTDDMGCTSVSSVTLSEPNALSISSSTNDVSSYGGNDGAVNITVTGGTTPYSYNWTSGATTEDLSGLTAGGYTLTVSDINACSDDILVTIFEPSGSGDDCTSPFVVDVPSSLTYYDANQTTCGHGNSYSDTELNTYDEGEDVVYKLNVAEETNVRITLDPLATIETGLALYADCPSTNNAMVYVADATADPRIIETVLAPGAYYVLVDQLDPACFNFDFTIEKLCLDIITNVDISICSNEEVFVGGAMQNTTGVYYDTLSSIEGCDSIIVTNLTVIDDLPTAIITSSSPVCQGTEFDIHGEPLEISCDTCNLSPASCESSSLFDSYFHIFKVELDGNIITSGASNYTDNTSSALATLYVGQTYTLKVYIHNNTSNPNVACSLFDENDELWPPWDDDCDGEGDWGDDTLGFCYTFTVPQSTQLGEKRIRIITNDAATQDYCGMYQKGETEDYMVEIKAFDSGTSLSYNWAGPNGWTSINRENLISNITTDYSGEYNLTVTNAAGCSATAQTDILVSNPVIDFDYNYAITMNPDTIILYPGVFDSYLWSTGETSSFIVPSYGQYSVSVTLNGCENNDMVQIDERQEIVLNEGWSMFSTYIDNTNPIDAVLADISNDVIMVKNGNGDVYWTAFGVNTIGNMIIGDAYLIKMVNTRTLNVEGSAVNPVNHPIVLNFTYNHLGYLRKTAASVVDMMSPISAQMMLLKDGNGQVYWPMFGLDLIGNMLPGEGYKINMKFPATLVYPANDAAVAKSNVIVPELKYYSEPKSTGKDMTIAIPANAWNVKPLVGDEIAVFDANGTITGASVYTGQNMAISVWGLDELADNKNGMSNYETMTFEIYHKASGTTNKFEISSWLEGDGKFHENAIAIADKVEFVEIISELNLSNYPNPFSDYTTIEFNLNEKAEVEISLYNVLGEKLTTIVKGIYDKGINSVNYESGDLRSGNYIIKLNVNGEIISKPIQLIK